MTLFAGLQVYAASSDVCVSVQTHTFTTSNRCHLPQENDTGNPHEKKRNICRYLLHHCFLKGGAPPSMNSNGEREQMVRNLGRASQVSVSSPARPY